MSSPTPNADPRFVKYYEQQSASEATLHRFQGAQRVVLKVRRDLGRSSSELDVLDVGCGAGTQALMWANQGHRVQGVDISAPLIGVARQRAEQSGLSARFHDGSADRLPVPDGSMDVVLVSELLEHLPQWEPCVNEAIRVLRPDGVLYLSTTNVLCPRQQEFDLPLYSWYPGWLKRRCERMAVTTHGHWVQHVSFPAVHWFSFYGLREYLRARGLQSCDRFDVIETGGSTLRRLVVGLVRAIPPLRWLGHVMTPYTVVVGYR